MVSAREFALVSYPANRRVSTCRERSKDDKDMQTYNTLILVQQNKTDLKWREMYDMAIWAYEGLACSSEDLVDIAICLSQVACMSLWHCRIAVYGRHAENHNCPSNLSTHCGSGNLFMSSSDCIILGSYPDNINDYSEMAFNCCGMSRPIKLHLRQQ